MTFTQRIFDMYPVERHKNSLTFPPKLVFLQTIHDEVHHDWAAVVCLDPSIKHLLGAAQLCISYLWNNRSGRLCSSMAVLAEFIIVRRIKNSLAPSSNHIRLSILMSQCIEAF